jgi:type 1 glutamine amidotransferase
MMKIFAVAVILLFSIANLNAQNKVLIITGGHDFEEKPFYEMFDSFQGLAYDTITQPKGNALLENAKIKAYSCLVFYDMFQDITENQKAALLRLLDDGMGMVFLHHALVSYQNWPEFEKIIGGKYHLKPSNGRPASTYKHDVDFSVKIVSAKDALPITKGLQDFEIHDEVYGSYSVGNHVTPIIQTDHPESTPTIGWSHQYKNSRIVYLQLGHDHYAYENNNYRTLVQRSIWWVSQNP